MTSIARQIARRHFKPAPKPQYFKMRADGGYRTLHPTKGWREVSPKRLAHGMRGPRR